MGCAGQLSTPDHELGTGHSLAASFRFYSASFPDKFVLEPFDLFPSSDRFLLVLDAVVPSIGMILHDSRMNWALSWLQDFCDKVLVNDNATSKHLL